MEILDDEFLYFLLQIIDEDSLLSFRFLCLVDPLLEVLAALPVGGRRGGGQLAFELQDEIVFGPDDVVVFEDLLTESLNIVLKSLETRFKLVPCLINFLTEEVALGRYFVSSLVDEVVFLFPGLEGVDEISQSLRIIFD